MTCAAQPCPVELALLDRWQRDFPLAERPFAQAGSAVGLGEGETIAAFARLQATGVLSRIGAVVRPNTAGASTLAAMRVPPERLEQVAALVSAQPRVNHNYEREHDLNLWFVIAGPDRAAVTDTIARIETATGLPVLDLPMVEGYHIDLGFPLAGGPARKDLQRPATGYRPDRHDRALLAEIEDGLPLTLRPYRTVAEGLGTEQDDVLARLDRLMREGVISRFGCVVRHRALGYRANAMAVWDVPDDQLTGVAPRLARHPRVTLCYRRPRRLPGWRYNLFCMIHATSRDDASASIREINEAAGTGGLAQDVLFSLRCFKQRGATFSDTAEARA